MLSREIILPWCVRLEPNKPSAHPVGSAIVYQGSDLFWKVFGEKLSQISDCHLLGRCDISRCKPSEQSLVSINQLIDKPIFWCLISLFLIAVLARHDQIPNPVL